MWQALNLSKRVDAVEKGLIKLSSMVEDLIQDVAGVDLTPKSGRSGGPNSTTTGSGGRLKAGGEDSPEPSSPGDTTYRSEKPSSPAEVETPNDAGEQKKDNCVVKYNNN